MNQNNLNYRQNNINNITTLIYGFRKKYHKVEHFISYSGNLVSPREAKRRLTLQLYAEVLLILDRIKDNLSCLGKLEELKIKYLNSRKKHGKISPKSELYKVIIGSSKCSDYLILDITSLFQWIFVIDELLGKKRTFSKHILAFRNKFNIHYSERIKKKRRDRQLMRSYLSSEDGIFLIYSPFFNKNGFRGFNKIEKEIEKYIPVIKKKSNLNEKVKLIWNNIDKLPKSMRNPSSRNKDNFINRLSQYGIISPSIQAVVEDIIKVWDKKVVPLCKYEKITI